MLGNAVSYILREREMESGFVAELLRKSVPESRSDSATRLYRVECFTVLGERRRWSLTMLLSSNASPRNKKDAFTGVAIAVCISGQIAIQNPSCDYIQEALKCFIASSIGLVVISDPQLAH